jgi:hypothetical protein
MRNCGTIDIHTSLQVIESKQRLASVLVELELN